MIRDGLRVARTYAAAGLEWISAGLERHGWAAISLVVAIYLAGAFDMSRHKPLWHDELFTWYIAQAPTLGAMWSDLRTHDLNPPMIYLLSRISFRLLGVNVLAIRLPEVGGFLLAVLCVFRFVRVRMGVVYGTLAAALLVAGKDFPLAVESRPYALVLGFVGLAMVGWQAAATETGRLRRVGICCLLVGCVGMLLSHVFAVLPLAALVLAEAWRGWERRRVDGAVAAALLGPLGVTAVYAPMLRNHGAALFPAAFVPSGNTIFEFYVWTIDRELVALLLTGLAVLLVLGVGCLRGAISGRARSWFFSAPEWVLLVGLMAGPLLLLLELMVTQGAFFNRYGAVEGLAVAVITALLVGRWTGLDRRAGVLGLGIVLGISGLCGAITTELIEGDLIPTVANSTPALPACEVCRRTAALDVTLPLVAASGLTFVEMSHNEEEATTSRLVYLTDAAGSAGYAHANIFERMPALVSRFHLRGSSEDYARFVSGHRHFFVFGTYDYPEDWVLQELLDDGAMVRLVGRDNGIYKDHEIYEVSFAGDE